MIKYKNWLISIGLFVLALLPRVLDLDRFLTADEFLWVDRSRNFLAGLTNSAYQCTTRVESWEIAEGLACTLRTGHPGVTTMWTGSFGFVLRWLWDGRPTSLHEYVVAVSTNPLDPSFIAPERLGTVLLTSLWVVAVYWLLRRLFGEQIALIGALLLALNPFHIAHSRVIHHDALSTTFTTLSALCAFIYWGKKGGKRWLWISGVVGGLAFISKIASLFMMPFIAATGLWFFVFDRRQTQRPLWARETIPDFIRLVGDGLLWFFIAVTTVYLVWPAFWVAPVETFQLVFSLGTKYATGAHAKGNFFLGVASSDPGLFFYPVTWLYRTTPLILIGLVGGFGIWLRTRRQDTFPETVSTFLRYLPLMLVFILGYMVMLTIGEKKQERYFLPAYPWVDIITGVGLVLIINAIATTKQQVMRYATGVAALIIAINGFFVAFNYPYYLTYYNPIFGGGNAAEWAVTVGWGEGLDLAADYLNTKEDAEQLRVASWYQSTFAPYYKGEALSYSKEKGKVLAGDYAVFYINQTQRRYPDDVLFDYFDSNFPIEQTISLHGIDYAWIYPSLGVDHYVQDQSYTGIASLLAWQWQQGDTPLVAGETAAFELYWEFLGKDVEEAFFFRLIDGQSRSWAEGKSQPISDKNPPVNEWRVGEIIAEQGEITLPKDIPPGQYQLQIGFYTTADAVKEGELLFELLEEEALITVSAGDNTTSYIPPKEAISIDQTLDDSLTLMAATIPEKLSLAESQTLPVTLFWRVEKPIPADFTLHVGFMDTSNEPQQAWFGLSLSESFNASETLWQPGNIIQTRWSLELLPEIPPDDYSFDLVLPSDIEQILSFGKITVEE